MPVLYSIGCVALGNSGDRPKRKCNSVELFSFHSIVTFYLCVLGRLYSEQYYFLKYFPLVNRTRVKIQKEPKQMTAEFDRSQDVQCYFERNFKFFSRPKMYIWTYFQFYIARNLQCKIQIAKFMKWKNSTQTFAEIFEELYYWLR